MNESSANSVVVALLFILRCLVPLLVLFGVAYLLRRLGLVAVEAPEPADEDWEDEEEQGDGKHPRPQKHPVKKKSRSSQRQKES